MQASKPASFWSKIPSIVWVIILPAGLALFVGGIIFLFWALATVEGVASIALLIAGFLSFGALSSPIFAGVPNKADTGGGPIILAMGVVFFALMGMSIDQTGNVIYNKPLEMYYCPPATQLVRTVDISNPLPGTTYVIQDFNCVDVNQTVVKKLGMWDLVIGRFVEYVILGYILFYLAKALNHFRSKTKKV